MQPFCPGFRLVPLFSEPVALLRTHNQSMAVLKSGARTPVGPHATGTAAAHTRSAVRILLAVLDRNSAAVAIADDAILMKVTMPLAIALTGCAKTNAQVAIWLVLVSCTAVGAVG